METTITFTKEELTALRNFLGRTHTDANLISAEQKIHEGIKTIRDRA